MTGAEIAETPAMLLRKTFGFDRVHTLLGD